jgi:hypothetical protein
MVITIEACSSVAVAVSSGTSVVPAGKTTSYSYVSGSNPLTVVPSTAKSARVTVDDTWYIS